MTHSNFVMADCPPNMEENIMKQSDKLQHCIAASPVTMTNRVTAIPSLIKGISNEVC